MQAIDEDQQGLKKTEHPTNTADFWHELYTVLVQAINSPPQQQVALGTNCKAPEFWIQ